LLLPLVLVQQLSRFAHIEFDIEVRVRVHGVTSERAGGNDRTDIVVMCCSGKNPDNGLAPVHSDRTNGGNRSHCASVRSPLRMVPVPHRSIYPRARSLRPLWRRGSCRQKGPSPGAEYDLDGSIWGRTFRTRRTTRWRRELAREDDGPHGQVRSGHIRAMDQHHRIPIEFPIGSVSSRPKDDRCARYRLGVGRVTRQHNGARTVNHACLHGR
jgi:hypothetical protein